MKRICLALLFVFAASWSALAQIVVENAQETGNWAEYYVEEILLGEGIEAFNISFEGDSMQIGEFWNGQNSNLQLNDGLIMASGDVNLADSFPNNGSLTAGFPTALPQNYDSILTSLSAPLTTNHVAILEFDFVPTGDTVRFNYVFASEEYNFYVCTQFNDVFGFFLSGPGITGIANLAVVPGTNLPVAVNNINDGKAGFGQSPQPCTYNTNNCACNSQYYVNNNFPTAGQTVSYNGFTVPLEAKHEVICGDTYHIRLAIADVSDGALDSGVFLEGGSFSSNLIEVQIETVNGDSTINEGCGTADILFTRGDTTDTSISYLSFSGTATNGVDFTALPDTIILLPGVQDSIITINPFADGLPEGMEYITISAMSITQCNDTFISTGTMYIYDVPNIVFDKSPDTSFTCPPDSFILWAHALSGGPPPFTYQWSTGDTLDTIMVGLSPNGGVDTFIVGVQDSCQLTTVYDTIFVFKNYADDPVPNIINDSLVNCAGQSIELACLVNFGIQPLTYAWSTGDLDSTAVVTVSGNTTVVLSVTDGCGRVRVDSAFLGVKVPDTFQIDFPDTMAFCLGYELTVEPTFSGGVGPYLFAWNENNTGFGNDSAISIMVYGDTTVHLWIQDVCGRQYYSSFEIDAFDVEPLGAFLSSQEALCSGEDFLLAPEVSGGLPPFEYEWSTGSTDSAIQFFGNVSQLVFVTITDFCGNQTITSADIFVPENTELTLTLSGDNVLCFGDEYIIRAQALGGAGGYDFEWFSVEDPIIGEMYQQIDSATFRVIARQNNTHYVRVSDQCGNATSDTLRLEVTHCLEIPNVITPNGDGWNDAFYINNITSFPDAHLIIYNRWGQKLFESKPYLNEWVPVEHPSGTYYYILSSDHFPVMRGDVMIIHEEQGR